MPGFVWHVFRILMGLFIVLFMHSHRADPWAVDWFQPSYQALYGMHSGRLCQALYGMVFGMVLLGRSSGGVIVCYRILGFCYGGYARVVWSPSGWFVVTFWEGSIRVPLPGRGVLLGDCHTDIRPVGPLGVLFLLGVI